MKKSIYLGLILLGSCTPKVYVDYAIVSTPEEGAAKFTQYTKEGEKVSGPTVERYQSTTGEEIVSWYAPSYIAISPDGKKICFSILQNGFNTLVIKDINVGG
jgi:hypothetical protein